MQAVVQLLPALLLPLWVNECFQSQGAFRILKQLIKSADPHHMKHVGSRQLQRLSFLRLLECNGALGIAF